MTLEIWNTEINKKTWISMTCISMDIEMRPL